MVRGFSITRKTRLERRVFKRLRLFFIIVIGRSLGDRDGDLLFLGAVGGDGGVHGLVHRDGAAVRALYHEFSLVAALDLGDCLLLLLLVELVEEDGDGGEDNAATSMSMIHMTSLPPASSAPGLLAVTPAR